MIIELLSILDHKRERDYTNRRIAHKYGPNYIYRPLRTGPNGGDRVRIKGGYIKSRNSGWSSGIMAPSHIPFGHIETDYTVKIDQESCIGKPGAPG